MYRVSPVHLTDQEQRELDTRRMQQTQMTQNVSWGPGGSNRPRKQLYIVSFKCSRVDVFYLLDNTGLTIKDGDMVIVEADRGQDLGTVQHSKVTPDHARILKKKYSEEQYKWLMMYSRNKEGGFNPNAQLHGESSMMGGGGQLFPDAPATMQGTIPRDNFNNLKPKAIKRLANNHEIKMLAEKEGNEAKAKRTCQQKVAHLRLQMEILDAEWQWYVEQDRDSRVMTLIFHQGLPEADFLLLCRPLHQFQRLDHRALPYLQDPHLALRHQSSLILAACYGPATHRHRPRRRRPKQPIRREQRLHDVIRRGP